MTILLTILGIHYTILYSSKYRIKRVGHHRERYQVIEKISHQTKAGFIDSMRIILNKSSVDNAMGFMDLSITNNSENIYVDRYAFLNAYTHILFSPGKYILHKNMEWTENPLSKGFEIIIKSKRLDYIPNNLIPDKIKNKVSDCMAVESFFEWPSNYTGYRYKKRVIILAKGIGIVFCQIQYSNDDKDTYRLEKFRVSNSNDCWFPFNKEGNYWVYEIASQSNPTQHIICE